MQTKHHVALVFTWLKIKEISWAICRGIGLLLFGAGMLAGMGVCLLGFLIFGVINVTNPPANIVLSHWWEWGLWWVGYVVCFAVGCFALFLVAAILFCIGIWFSELPCKTKGWLKSNLREARRIVAQRELYQNIHDEIDSCEEELKRLNEQP